MKQPLYLPPCLRDYSIAPRGILHVGAGCCEEASEYEALGFKTVIWVDALTEKVADLRIGKLITAVLDWTIKDAVEFHVSSNRYSSSLLPFGSHATLYPEITEDKTILLDTTTGAALMAEYSETENCNVLSVDVQGAEFRVICGFGPRLRQFDCIYSEVYLDEVYVGCGKLFELDNLLWAYGYVRMETWIKPTHGWGNAFYMRRSLL